MTSLIIPSLVSEVCTNHSLMDTIKGTTDLQYINRKLLEFGFSQTETDLVDPRKAQIEHPIANCPSILNLVAQNTANFIGSNVSETFKPDSPEYLSPSSPDSRIPCSSPECPIKDVPHNVGRYFHNGEVPRPALDRNQSFTMKGSREDISNTFNHTVPPPEVITAYLKTCVGLHSQGDLDIVRQYQKHHMWSPVTSEVSTPRPRNLFPNLHGRHGQEVNDSAETTSPGLSGIPQSIGTNVEKVLRHEDLATRSLQSCDFEESDDEDETFPPPRNEKRELEGSSQRLPSPEVTRRADKSYGITPTVEIPCGLKLESDKLQIQENMLREMAKQQRLQQAYRGSCCGWIRKDTGYSKGHYDGKDIEMEVILELMEALPKALEDGGLRSILLDERFDNTGFSGSEREVIYDLQVILRKIFADMISNAKRPYQPTGLPVTTTQLQNALFSAISLRPQNVASNPERVTARMLDKFWWNWQDVAR